MKLFILSCTVDNFRGISYKETLKECDVDEKPKTYISSNQRFSKNDIDMVIKRFSNWEIMFLDEQEIQFNRGKIKQVITNHYVEENEKLQQKLNALAEHSLGTELRRF